MPPEKLRGTITHIFNADVIDKEMARLVRIGMLGGVAGRHRNANAVADAVEEWWQDYRMRVIDTTPWDARGYCSAKRVLPGLLVPSIT